MKHLTLIPCIVLALATLVAPSLAYDERKETAAGREELGQETSDHANNTRAQSGRPVVEVLLIPDSNADAIGMYDPSDGTYLGDFNSTNPGFSTPINAVQGPDLCVYVSDQIADAIFVFDFDGHYLSTYADASDGLNNIRGIAFRGDELFVCSGDDYIARFAGPHNRLADWVSDGSDPFDLFFLPDGSALVADIQGTTDNIRYYDALGTLQYELFSVDFPEQIQFDSMLPGEFLNVAFSADVVTDFDLDGSVHNTWAFNGGRGVFRLYNGNLLLTAGDGVWSFDPATGGLTQQNTGSARFIEMLQGVSSADPAQPQGRLILQSAPLLNAGGVQIMFELPHPTPIEVGIYDVRGAQIARVMNGQLEAGAHSLIWDGRTTRGRMAASGLYFAHLRTRQAAVGRQILLLR